jgi:hypothetical protein
MNWQDWVIMGCNFAFSAALLPALRPGARPMELWTAIITAAGLWVLALTYATLVLVVASLSCMVAAVLWTMLLVLAARPAR